MKFLKKPFAAVLLSIIIVLCSTVISINVKLNNKCESLIDKFYEGGIEQGFVVDSIYGNLCRMYELAEEIVLVADNYGVDTRELSSNINALKETINYKNHDMSEIYSNYSDFYSSLRAVEIELSNIQLSQRHMEYMNSASEQISYLKSCVDDSNYNESVRTFYKKFDRFPVNIFADLFNIEYPEYFA